ncbi:MAG TPA: class I SAM-dependent methyltransferase [Planctomycetota bacterium]
MSSTRSKKVRGQPPKFTARTADKHELYELSVQQADVDVKFVDRIFKKRHDRVPLLLREDFCGTAWMCAEWVLSHKERRAVGLDLDQDTMDWGWQKHMVPLGEDARRVKLVRRNVLKGWKEAADVVVAFNFSYCTFHTRAELLGYFRAVHESLADDGLFLLDIYGGPDAQCELDEERDKEDFTYVWDQRTLDAVNNRAIRHIHFVFKDGSRLKKAFTYDWRIWSLPEMRDVLIDAGFAAVDVYWEGSDAEGEGNGVFRKVEKADNEEAWISYVAAWK